MRSVLVAPELSDVVAGVAPDRSIRRAHRRPFHLAVSQVSRLRTGLRPTCWARSDRWGRERPPTRVGETAPVVA